jgi:hypothetical protein
VHDQRAEMEMRCNNEGNRKVLFERERRTMRGKGRILGVVGIKEHQKLVEEEENEIERENTIIARKRRTREEIN